MKAENQSPFNAGTSCGSPSQTRNSRRREGSARKIQMYVQAIPRNTRFALPRRRATTRPRINPNTIATTVNAIVIWTPSR